MTRVALWRAVREPHDAFPRGETGQLVAAESADDEGARRERSTTSGCREPALALEAGRLGRVGRRLETGQLDHHSAVPGPADDHLVELVTAVD